MAKLMSKKTDAVQVGNDVIVRQVQYFDLAETFECGQAFRFQCKDGIWQGVAQGTLLELCQQKDTIIFYNTSLDDFFTKWYTYFSFDIDYKEIIKTISQDETLKCATSFANGIHILRQESWEMLCSFIISQNNHIPRIKGIIDRLCSHFGEHIRETFYTFPTAEKIADLTVEDLSVIRAGFRAKYIIDAAKKVASGEVELEPLKYMPYDIAKETLMKIKGVGQKVADCVLLFGCGRLEAFPVDVWMKRVMTLLFPDGLPECAVQHAGITQQYLFHYARMNNIK